MKDLVIIGAGDTGREIVDLVERINLTNRQWKVLGFVDDNEELVEKTIEGFPILGTVNWLNNVTREIYAVCSISNGIIKKTVLSKIKNSKIKFATLVDPRAQFFKGSVCGEGCIIYSGAVLAIHAKLGNHIYISLNSTVGHDSKIGDYCCIFPGVNISGKVCIEECVDFGTGSKVTQGVKIGENTTIGAGAVVLKSLPDNCVAVGCPAKPVRIIAKKGKNE